jgi:hypothetical protein
MSKPKISETPLDLEITKLIQSCAATAARLLSVNGDEVTPAAMVDAIDACVYQLQHDGGPELSAEEEPEYLFGSLWGEQLVRQLGWQWAQVVFHEYDDSQAVGVFSPDRALAIYPIHFIHGCLENDAPVTIALAFNMLVDGKRIPKLPQGGYENVMDNVHHIVPRD